MGYATFSLSARASIHAPLGDGDNTGSVYNKILTC
jgi:hypothetical protein